MDARKAALLLAIVVEPGTSGFCEELAVHGSIEALARLRRGHGPGGRGARARLANADPVRAEDQVLAMGGRVILPGEAQYPTQLADLEEPPLALWALGPLDVRRSALRSVALVGARACTAYGDGVAHGLAADLAALDWAVVSGAAFGIDAAAHRGALSVDGPTIAVLACGVDVAYPRSHERLLRRIAEVGAVVSELPPGAEPLRFRFLTRNRVIAALTRGTVVVEAASRSGAVATANRAAELGRTLMAVPGPVTSMASAGTNRLIHDQLARAVCDCDEVVSVLVGPGVGPIGQWGGTDGVGAPVVDSDGSGGVGPAGVAGLPEEAMTVLGKLRSRGYQSEEAISASVGLDCGEVLCILGLLELAGWAVRGQLGWRAAANGANRSFSA